MSVEHRALGEWDVLELGGELDLTNTLVLEEALLSATADTVILDLGGVAFIDSAGIHAIDQAHRRLAEAGRSLLIVAPDESRAAWIFRVAGFGDGVVLDSQESAVAQVEAANTL